MTTFAITGTFHGSIVYAETEGEARQLFHKAWNGESIIHVTKRKGAYILNAGNTITAITTNQGDNRNAEIAKGIFPQTIEFSVDQGETTGAYRRLLHSSNVRTELFKRTEGGSNMKLRELEWLPPDVNNPDTENWGNESRLAWKTEPVPEMKYFVTVSAIGGYEAIAMPEKTIDGIESSDHGTVQNAKLWCENHWLDYIDKQITKYVDGWTGQKPHRTYEVQILIGNDTWHGVEESIQDICDAIMTQKEKCGMVMGGCSGSHMVTCNVDLSMTNELYHEKLKAYLKSRNERVERAY